MIELREKYFEPGLIEKFIKGDLFKLDWYNELDTTLSTLLIVAGVFQYFHEKDVAEFIENVKDIFENAEMIFEAANRFGNIYCSFYVKRTGNKSARMYFYIEDEKFELDFSVVIITDKRLEDVIAAAENVSEIEKVLGAPIEDSALHPDTPAEPEPTAAAQVKEAEKAQQEGGGLI